MIQRISHGARSSARGVEAHGRKLECGLENENILLMRSQKRLEMPELEGALENVTKDATPISKMLERE